MIPSILIDFLNLFYPNHCASCNEHLSNNENSICTYCLHDLPYSYYSNKRFNPIESIFFGKIPLKSATALFLFEKQSRIQHIVHELKYRNNEKIGELLAELLASELTKKIDYTTVDYIIPVPIHPKKLKTRGYNQLTKLGEKLSKRLNITFQENLLSKKHSSETQTKKNKLNRWKNAQESFELIDNTFLENKTILLIDDVITTGATLEACANELLKTKNLTLHIATIAHTIKF